MSTDLRRHAVGLLDVAREQEVELLVGAAELHVGVDRHRVVALEQRVEQLEDRDRRAGRVALGEVVALEQLRHRGGARERGTAPPSACQPLAVAAHLGAVGVEHRERLAPGRSRALRSISSGVEHRPRRGAAARVPHARRVVADDQHHRVADVLELAQLAEHHHVAEVDVGRGRVDPELHPQRPALAELALELPLGKGVDDVPEQERHRACDSVMGPMLESRARRTASGVPPLTPPPSLARLTDARGAAGMQEPARHPA